MVRVRFNDPNNLASCESFLTHAFPGEATRNGQILVLTFRLETLQPTVETTVVERLLWAWRRARRRDDDGFILPIDQEHPTGS